MRVGEDGLGAGEGEASGRLATAMDQDTCLLAQLRVAMAQVPERSRATVAKERINWVDMTRSI